MKLPLSWLKEYINISYNPDELAKRLTMAGIEVDSIEKVPLPFKNVVVGKVLATEKHPNADKLCIAKVTDGSQEFQVVCGAPNCRTGLKTAFAPVGAILFDEQGKEFKIKNSKIRGVESSGMLCSTEELGLGSDHDGIIELPEETPEGASVDDLFADLVFELSLTPNLGHCSSLMGIVRELSASTAEPFRIPNITVSESLDLSVGDSAKVSILNKEHCPRYTCRVIKGVKIGPSPEWLKKRVEVCGIRSVNNVVDVTNLVLLEMGHPLHAFDYDKLSGHAIQVRSAKTGERFITLDGKERLLQPNNLLICDAEKPVALAGIMGGQNSEITDGTVNILLESAYFNPICIRKTCKQLLIQTDSSVRFVRGTDPNNLIPVLDRAAMLIQQVAGGQVAAGVIDVKAGDFSPKEIPCRFSRICHVLGTHFSFGEVENIFQRLGFKYTPDGQDLFTVLPPTFRVDITSEVDLIEEVARIYGYDNFPKPPPRYTSATQPHAPIFVFEREMRGTLIGENLQEFITCDLIGPTLENIVQDTSIDPQSIVKVLNPTSIEQSILRTSLLPGMLQLVKYNFDHSNQNIHGFEIGRVHFKSDDHYKEQAVAGIVLAGKEAPHHWGVKPGGFDFYDLKGMIENVFDMIGIDSYSFKSGQLNIFHTGRQAEIWVDQLRVGSLGEVHPAVLRRLDYPHRVYFAELNLHDLFLVRRVDRKMADLPIYPGSDRGWTITLNEKMPIEEIFRLIHGIPSRTLDDVSLVDIYRSEKLGSESKNVTFHFVYRDDAKTLSQEEVDAEHARLTNEVLTALGKTKI